MIIVIGFFIFGFVALFLGLMMFGVLTVIWPGLAVVGLYCCYRRS